MTRTPTRRRLLRAIGVAATATLAGCSSGGEKENTSNESTGTTDAGTTTTGSGTSADAGTTDRTTTSKSTSETGTQTTDEETTQTTTGSPPPEGGGDVQFTTASGDTVHGTLVGDGSCSVVFAHDVGFDRKDWLPLAKKLADGGYTCLLIDLNLKDGSTAPEYVLAASRYLRQRVGANSVILVGAGAGADAVVRANARAKSGTIDGTMALSPESGVDSASAMQGWKLFVVANGDDQKYVRTAKRMHEAAKNPKRLERISGSAHGQSAVEKNENAVESILNSLLMTACDEG